MPETLLDPTALSPEAPPPQGLAAFYWHFAGQAKGLVVALFLAGMMVAALDTTIPVFIGRVVTLVSSHAPETLLRDAGPQLLGMALVLLVLRPAASLSPSILNRSA